GRPQAFSWEGPFCGVVNQADQIQLMRHRRELPADCLQREEQSAIRHKRNCRRDDSPYTAFMVCPLGRKGKICSANGNCPISALSQKRAQAISSSFRRDAPRPPLEAMFRNLPFEPYAQVRRQFLSM